MKIVFMGTPTLAVPALAALHAEHEVALVVTQPDKPAGRYHQVAASPVKQFAVAHGLPVAQPARARDDAFVAQLRAVAPEAIAVVAFGQILPRSILELAPRGCVNVHFSLLPRWRGAAPVQYAILNGDPVTGVTTQWIAEKLDSGDIILQRQVAIEAGETAGILLERLTPLGAETLRETMDLMAAGTAPRKPQDEAGVTWAPAIKKEDGHINWTQPATTIANRVRAFNPWPTAWCQVHDHLLKVWRAEAVPLPEAAACLPPGSWCANEPGVVTGAGLLRLIEVQPAGKPRLAAVAWARGARLAPGAQLS